MLRRSLACLSTASGGSTLLQALLLHVQSSNLSQAADVHDAALRMGSSSSGSGSSLGGQQPLAQPPHERRDVACLMLRVYTSLGKKDKLRSVFLTALDTLPPRYVTSVLYDHFLEALTKSKFFVKDEITEVLAEMQSRGVAWSPWTYLYLIELHLRMDVDPSALWHKMLRNIPAEDIPEAAVRAMAYRVLPVTKDPKYIVSIVQQMLSVCSEVTAATLVHLLNLIVENPDCSPQTAVWLLMELEQRCLLSHDDAQALPKVLQPHVIVKILYRCAKSVDVPTMELLVGLIDRHGMTKSSDMLALAVMTYASGEHLERALDLVELMGRKGMLDLQDPFKKFAIDALGIQLDRHFLMAVSEAMQLALGGVERGYQHLLLRVDEARSVTVHSLDLVVLAASKQKDDGRALAILDAYSTSFHCAPRTTSYNCLLTCVIGHRNAQLHHDLFTKMEKNGIPPNPVTFRFLIRHCLQCDDVFAALEYIRRVGKYPHIRIDVEMLLPIMERSGRVGDLETAVEMSQLALDCDVGIDPAVMNNVAKLLTAQGHDVGALKAHGPLHEALRARSKGLLRRGNNRVRK